MIEQIKESEIKELLRTREGKEMFMRVLLELEKEKTTRYRDWLKCPKCEREGNWAVVRDYLAFWHWIKDEATKKKLRKWCYIGKIVDWKETNNAPIIYVIASKTKNKQKAEAEKQRVEGEKEKNLETPPNATKTGD